MLPSVVTTHSERSSLRLLYICHHRKHKTFRSGGFAAQMVKRGHDATLVCVSEARRLGISEYLQDGVRYVEMPDLLPGKLRSGWDLWNTWNRLRFLRDRPFDLIHAFETRPATIYPIMSLLRRAPAPLVIDWVDWWGRGGLIREQRPLWYQILFGGFETYYEEHFRILADGTTVISRGLGARAQSLGVLPETIYWIPSGSDARQVEVAPPERHRAEFGLTPDSFLLGFSALDVVIGIGLVLETARILAENNPNVLLIMTGKQSRELTRQVREKGLDRHVRHYGILPFDLYMKLLSCVDVFVLPFVDTVANRGRWPGRIRDYMAVARPVVSNPVGEMKILLSEEEIGFLADENPAAMAQKIMILRDDPSLRARLGRNARQLAEQRFSLEGMTHRLETCYNETSARWQKKRNA
jgi:glycosyltransferase involved in cell wall biosynthesis